MDVIKLTEVVNDVLQSGKVSDEQIEMLSRYARMGVEETGETKYKLLFILANELSTTREGLTKLVATAPVESVREAAGLKQGEPQRTITQVDDPQEELPVNDGPEEHDGDDDNDGEASEALGEPVDDPNFTPAGW